MQADFNRLKRRPFLVPLLMPLALLAVVIAAGIWLFDARATSMVIVARNAETETSNSADPKLSDKGVVRARALQQFLARAKPGRGVDVVYVSEGVATQLTAAPVAESMGLAVNVVPDATWPTLLSTISREHAGEVILVVATRPKAQAFLTQSGVADTAVDEQDYSPVWFISWSRLSKSAAIRLQY